MPARTADENPKYWREYSNLQRTKHELIRHYLGGWYAKKGGVITPLGVPRCVMLNASLRLAKTFI